MLSGRSLRGFRFSVLSLLLAAQQASAGVFDDDEARLQIRELTKTTNERFDITSRAHIELANQIQALRDENARLRGLLETLSFKLESADKRQQDFYVDVDGRLRKLEPQPQAEARPGDEMKPPVEPPKRPAGDPALEASEYEAALNSFKTNKIKEAAAAFEAFTRAHPDSTLAPSAQYWLGNAHYALRDCRKAIDAQKLVLAKWPGHVKAPDAMINIATCQQELGDVKGARASLETVLIKYPDSAAASTAKQRLKSK